MIANADGFLVGQAGQGGTLAGNADLLDDVNQIFAVEIQFFCERVNACGHGGKILSIRLGTRHAFGCVFCCVIAGVSRWVRAGRLLVKLNSNPPTACQSESRAARGRVQKY